MVNIIIPVHNCFEYTLGCVESIIAQTKVNCKIIIVDNGSTDETKEYTWWKYGCAHIKLPENKGFAAAVNIGMDYANRESCRHRYMCLLNNDTIVTPKWLKRMIRHIEKKRLDIVSPQSNYVAGEQQIRIDDYNNIDELNIAANKFYTNNKFKCKRMDEVIGFCMIFPAYVYRDIGGMDDDFGKGNFEDVDFCWRARKAGYKVGMAKDVYIHHFGSKTFKDIMTPEEYNNLLTLNEKGFKKKWDVKPPEALTTKC